MPDPRMRISFAIAGLIAALFVPGIAYGAGHATRAAVPVDAVPRTEAAKASPGVCEIDLKKLEAFLKANDGKRAPRVDDATKEADASADKRPCAVTADDAASAPKAPVKAPPLG